MDGAAPELETVPLETLVLFPGDSTCPVGLAQEDPAESWSETKSDQIL